MLKPKNQYQYTYQLPYGTRREICNLLDADKSWRFLGGRFGLDMTQLTLIGQAIMRNGSPTEEILNRLDSTNASITDLYYHLGQLNHWRAQEILKPFILTDQNSLLEDNTFSANDEDVMMMQNSTLITPTPSFADQPMQISDFYQPNAFSIQGPLPVQTHQVEPSRACHRSNIPEVALRQSASTHQDPGEETVRVACVTNEKRTSLSDQEVVNQLRLIMQINYNELRVASNDFSDTNILGNGGFASVYRGNWKGTDVAIKRLKCNLIDQALNELTILNSYRIDNILPIYGISIDGPEACLVYQFMANGSLEDRLSCKDNTPPLTWQQRALIGEGLAKGLYYLHTLRDKPLVHGDVKSANVLLDSQFVPKLGDFGLARQVFKNKNLERELCTHCTVSSIHGTSVYLPDEYLRHRILSPAVDVYSFGIVLLEMGTGKRAFDGKMLLIHRVEDRTRSIANGEIDCSLKDPRLNDDDSYKGLKIWSELLIKLGLECAQRVKQRRPDMGQVIARYSYFRDQNPGLYDTNTPTIRPSSSAETLNPILLQQRDDATQEAPRQIPRRKPTPPAQFLPRQPLIDDIANSSLMAVQEEAINEGTKQADTTGAMIPLLTELGVASDPV